MQLLHAAVQLLPPLWLMLQIVDVDGESLSYLCQGMAHGRPQAAETAAAAAAAGSAAAVTMAAAVTSASTATVVAAAAAETGPTPSGILPTAADSSVPLAVPAVFSLSSRPGSIRKVGRKLQPAQLQHGRHC